MKLTIKLFIGLFLLAVTGLFLTHIELQGIYASIDKENPYYNYDSEVLNTSFDHIKFEGGNALTVSVEKGETPLLHIHDYHVEDVSYRFNRDTLIVEINEEETFTTEQFDPERGVRATADIVVSTPHFSSLTLENSAAVLDFEQSSITAFVKGNSILYGTVTTDLDLTKLSISEQSAVFLKGDEVQVDSLSLSMNGAAQIRMDGIAFSGKSLDLQDSCRLDLNVQIMYALMH